MTGLPTSVVYQISGLFSAPELVVSYDGRMLDCDEDLCYRLPDELTDTVRVLVPDYATVKLNGKTLFSSEITKKGVQVPILDGVTSFAKQRPYMTEYTVTGLLREGELSAFDKNGRPLEISAYYSTEDTVVYCCTRSYSMPEREKLTLRTFGREYVEYIYNGYTNLSSNYKSIIAMTPGSSNAYAALKATYSSLYNAPRYKSISVGTVEFLEYYSYTSTSYSVIMRIPFTAVLDGVTYSFEVTMDVLYIYSGQIRRIVNYKILNTVYSAA